MEKKLIKKHNFEKGITLIALVITIVILLILAVIAISSLTGDNGLLNRANQARTNTEIAEEKEKVKLSATSALADDLGGEIKESFLKQELENYFGTEGVGVAPETNISEEGVIVTIEDTGRQYFVDKYGNVSEYMDISKYVKIGEYVNYDPTVSDINGTPVEASKLTYTSPTGSGTEHGNGYTSSEEDGGQKFTATASTKWRILDIGTETVTLISEKPIRNDNLGLFTLRGAIGYLYAEQELHEICKIYGYGYGADTSQVTEYSCGGPTDGELTGRITGSGARSITREDINKLAGIYEDTNGILRFSNGTIVNSTYGSTTNPTVDIWYPTVTKSNGSSGSPGVRYLKYTNYRLW